ncbi:Transcriptional regulator, contains XRE-family HTH domain [Cyclobacterium xiamenense]|uniref:Transcriptional regulator, contains XRE-family HTH domain n=1 Tax=Cyclobacterium xiamenense TaxID=1297121 RepID=A0A1H6ZQU2_9BACT|nr:helix-turn-helix domain-containing protein [Cyclobacterium xiamenense]SEJ55618.1 Transcriptional regulator, contains XRE-family HTH domain [Cyclobacterium xiamenense]
MSKLKHIRERRNLTQEELSDVSGVSVRTIQRIESGAEPSGQTRKLLSKALGVGSEKLLSLPETPNEAPTSLLKVLSMSALPFAVIPPANILIPLLIMAVKKQWSSDARQILSIQIVWTIGSAIFFMLAAFVKKGLFLGGNFMLLIMVFLVLANVGIVLRNTVEIDRKGKLFFHLGFNLI